jgi:PAS domain S-box-containing protein
MSRSVPWIPSRQTLWRLWLRPDVPALVVAALLCLGAANVVSKSTWRPFDDGVFWRESEQGIVASEIDDAGPAYRRIQRGDLLLAVDGTVVEKPSDVWDVVQSGSGGSRLYTISRAGESAPLGVSVVPERRGPGLLYFVLASVGFFALFVGGGVRLRRPGDPATLHFLWLTVAFFGVFTFSYTGQLDRLDWIFYWADEIATLALPPLFLHFILVFPDRPRQWRNHPIGRIVEIGAYAPAFVLGLTRVAVLSRADVDPAYTARMVELLDKANYLYLSLCLIGGFVALVAAISQACTITARRQLRWIVWGSALGGVPFAVLYALPYALGLRTSDAMGLFAIPLGIAPLAYASAIVRYRLLDIEVIVKRSVMYVVALCAIALIYVVLLLVAPKVFRVNGAAYEWVIALLATLVAVLLAPPVKNAVHTLLDRAFYRDRYDYRRALVGFARDLNSDLDLTSLTERLVSRVVETLLVDRMVLMLESDDGARLDPMRTSGFGDARPPALERTSGIGAWLAEGQTVALDDPMSVSRFPSEEIEVWRAAGLHFFVPCVSKEKLIAVLALGRQVTGAHLNSEDMALMTAVAGQMATALENARLYRHLHVKALELDRLRAFNENILESLDDGLLVFDARERVLRWNTRLEQAYGVPSADAIGRPLAEVFDAPFVDAIRAARLRTPDGVTLSRLPLAGRGERAGMTLIVNAAVVPLRASDGAAAGAGTIVIIEDVTARVQLEEQLQISDKMASIGLLAAGVAHEVNTPLTGISSFTQMLLDGADPDDPRTQLLEKIERQTFRAAKIVNGLLNLSRPTESAAERTSLDLNAIIVDVLALLEHQFAAHRIKVRRELTEEPAIVLGLEHKLQQVLLNLFLNAKDAMPKGGWLSVSTRHADGRVVAEVSDTGSGIPSEHLTRIYDPFFTTKTMGQGTGLGLSISYGIIREHDGTIDCESVMGQGTRFVVSVPEAATGSLARPAQRQTRMR